MGKNHKKPWCAFEETNNEYACLTCTHPDCDAPSTIKIRTPRIWTHEETIELRNRVPHQSVSEIAVAMNRGRETIRRHINSDPICMTMKAYRTAPGWNNSLWRGLKHDLKRERNTG